MMTQVYWTLIINFSSTFWNITLNTWFHSFDTITNVIYFIYHFIFVHFTFYFNVNLTIYFNVDCIISHSRLPFPLSYFIWLPWQWYIRHTQRRACYCFLCLSEYGELTQRNTLCYISWQSPVSVINHKTMKAINRSQPTLTPLPPNNNLSQVKTN